MGLGSGGRRRAPLEAAPTKDCAAYWREVKPGDYISLSDAEAFGEALSSASRGSSIDYRVGEVRAFALRGPKDLGRDGPKDLGRDGPKDLGRAGAKDFGRGGARARPSGSGEFRFIELAPAAEIEGRPSGILYLAAVDLPEAPRFELRLYFIPEGIEGGNRDEWIDRGDAWLFLPPPDPENFLSRDLEFAPYPDLPEIEEGGRLVKRIYARSSSGELYAEALDTGAPTILVEYEADRGADGDVNEAPANPLLLVLEEGWMKSDGSEPEEGGFLLLMLGKVMRTSDVEHWPS
jgi:hypothetical protein